VGLALLLVVAGWYLLVARMTREQPVREPVPLPGDRVARLRTEYARQIDLVVSREEEGSISARSAHQQLSVLVRHFVQELSGIKAPTMTLTDLAANGSRLSPVAKVVSQLYPGEFAPASTASVAGAADVAKEVVRRWR
jgi:hypothetical protein